MPRCETDYSPRRIDSNARLSPVRHFRTGFAKTTQLLASEERYRALAEAFAQDKKAAEATPKPPPDFKGTIKLDIRDSKPDWTPFTPKAAPKGAPNVLVVLYDDTGLAAWSP